MRSESEGDGKRHLVVFDFDHTVVEVNSDPETVVGVDPENRDEHLALLHEAGACGAWTDGMDAALRRVAEHGKTEGDVRGVLRGIPLTEPGDAMRAALERLAAHPGTDLRIVSDANTVFIDEILRAHGLRGAFSAVVSNPAAWVPHGAEGHTRLSVTPYHDPGPSLSPTPDARGVRPAHACPRCPRNLCKGDVVAPWLAERAWASITYVGDGTNDVCPSLLLPSGGRVLAREGFPLAAAFRTVEPPLRAALHVWHDATRLADLLDPLKFNTV